MPVEAHHRRFVREAAKTAPVYDMELTEPAPLAVSAAVDGVATGTFSLNACGAGWAARTDFVLYGLGDITLFYASRNPALRLLSGLLALFDFIATGTFFRFVATSWRYALFFLYPLVTLFAIAAAAIVGGSAAGRVVSPSSLPVSIA
ncbi:MAG: hypothetical protein ACRECY_04765, partial [Phyllobacterium sp.]